MGVKAAERAGVVFVVTQRQVFLAHLLAREFLFELEPTCVVSCLVKGENVVGLAGIGEGVVRLRTSGIQVD